MYMHPILNAMHMYKSHMLNCSDIFNVPQHTCLCNHFLVYEASNATLYNTIGNYFLWSFCFAYFANSLHFCVLFLEIKKRKYRSSCALGARRVMCGVARGVGGPPVRMSATESLMRESSPLADLRRSPPCLWSHLIK